LNETCVTRPAMIVTTDRGPSSRQRRAHTKTTGRPFRMSSVHQSPPFLGALFTFAKGPEVLPRVYAGPVPISPGKLNGIPTHGRGGLEFIQTRSIPGYRGWDIRSEEYTLPFALRARARVPEESQRNRTHVPVVPGDHQGRGILLFHLRWLQSLLVGHFGARVAAGRLRDLLSSVRVEHLNLCPPFWSIEHCSEFCKMSKTQKGQQPHPLKNFEISVSTSYSNEFCF
jgi:hypothetical protein